MPRKALTMLAIMALPLSACIRDPAVGKGPIDLSPGAQQNFNAYQQERSPGHSAISTDGRVTACNYCPDGRCRASAKTNVIYLCEQRSGGKPCRNLRFQWGRRLGP